MLGRLVDDPPAARCWGWRTLAFVLVCVAVAHGLSDGSVADMTTAVTWIIAPLVALAVGYGEAFFLQHGRGRRRVTLMVIFGVIGTLTSCILLSMAVGEDSQVGQWVNLAGSMVLYSSVVVGLAGMLALGIGRGSSYVSRKIDDMRSDDW